MTSEEEILKARVLNFNHDWRFQRDDVEGGQGLEIDDSDWNSVSAPHTYNEADTFAHFQHKNHSGERKQWSGRTWYRKTFRLPFELEEKKVYLEFEAVRQLAEVYLNGVFLGKCENGFLPFGFDLTPHLRFGEDNLIALMCDNSFVVDEENEMKWSTYEGGAKHSWNNPHWHPAHGGIYRNVFLHVTDRLHVTLPLYSSLETTGVYVYTPEVSEHSATVGIEVQVQNEYEQTEEVEVCVEILDVNEAAVLSLSNACEIPGNAIELIQFSGCIQIPQLWDPERPYLYTARTTILRSGKEVDRVDTSFGVRTWKFTVDDGFYMNGRRLKLQGWGQKSTNEWAGLGTAIPDWMQHLTVELMRGAGGNLVRWGHTAGSPAQVKAADQLGLVTIQPGVDAEGDLEGHSWNIRAQAFRDAIVYFRNSPSILVWEGGNQAVTLEHVRELRGIADTFDPHGGRAYAHRRPSKVTNDYSDLEIGTQGGHKFRKTPVVEGEYNREECPRRVWDDFSPPDFGYKVPHRQEYELTSESFAANQVVEYVTRIGSQSHCGGAKWIFSDSTSGGRNDCEVTRAGGIVDAVRLPKEAYFTSRAIFDAEPRVHLIGHWTYPEDRVTEKAFSVVSNGSEVELFVNGESKGRGERSYHYLFTFGPLRWEPGVVKVVAYDESGEAVASQEKETVGPAVALKLTPVVGATGFMADGSDVALFDVEAIDDKGRRHPTFQRRVDFDCEGPAVWRGGYNSGQELSTNHPYLDLECGINRVAVRATREAGVVSLSARCEGLAEGKIQLEALPMATQGGVTAQLSPSPEVIFDGYLELVDEAGIDFDFEQSEGAFIKGFSYSGTRLSLPVMSNAEDGMQLYVDREDYVEEISEFLRGADYILTSDDERLYQAVDLMDFTVSEAGTLLIGHDSRLPLPAWMQDYVRFEEQRIGHMGAQGSVQLIDTELLFYSRKLEQNESVTLGSNREEGPDDCRMYSVIFVPDSVSGV